MHSRIDTRQASWVKRPSGSSVQCPCVRGQGGINQGKVVPAFSSSFANRAIERHTRRIRRTRRHMMAASCPLPLFLRSRTLTANYDNDVRRLLGTDHAQLTPHIGSFLGRAPLDILTQTSAPCLPWRVVTFNPHPNRTRLTHATVTSLRSLIHTLLLHKLNSTGITAS